MRIKSFNFGGLMQVTVGAYAQSNYPVQRSGHEHGQPVKTVRCEDTFHQSRELHG